MISVYLVRSARKRVLTNSVVLSMVITSANPLPQEKDNENDQPPFGKPRNFSSFPTIAVRIPAQNARQTISIVSGSCSVSFVTRLIAASDSWL